MWHSDHTITVHCSLVHAECCPHRCSVWSIVCGVPHNYLVNRHAVASCTCRIKWTISHITQCTELLLVPAPFYSYGAK